MMPSHNAVAKSTKTIVTSSTTKNCVEFNSADVYGKRLHDRNLFDVLWFKILPDPNRGGCFIGNNDKVKKQTQPIKGDYPADIGAGTRNFFVTCSVIEHPNIAGVKAPVPCVMDTERRLANFILQSTSATEHKLFLGLKFKKIVLETIRDIFPELVAVFGGFVPFAGTGRVAITLKFHKFQKFRPTMPGKRGCHTFRATQVTEEAV